MKTLEEIKKEVRKNFDVIDGWNVGGDTSDERFIDQVAKRYANEKLDEAAEKATIWIESEINGTEFKSVEYDINPKSEMEMTETVCVFKYSILRLKDEV